MSAKSPFPLKLPPLLVARAVAGALEEDLGQAGDITTDCIIPAEARGEAAIVARQAGVVAGLDLAEAAFKALDPDISFKRIVDDGGAVRWIFDDGSSLDGAHMARMVRYQAVSSKMGYREHPIRRKLKWHAGTDFAAPIGTPVRAFADGTILKADKNWVSGRFIAIKHDDGHVSKYLHLDAFAPKAFQQPGPLERPQRASVAVRTEKKGVRRPQHELPRFVHGGEHALGEEAHASVREPE